ncbi:MAG: ATP-binding protein [Bacteroidetes bacterium]|nr:ATP-binding protein [Bacteroidota bacterium]
MRLVSLEYENKALEWKLERTYFDDFNLLVGVSGVGKSLILRAILSLHEIAHGASVSGLTWSAEFEASGNKRYVWEGEFENIGVLKVPAKYERQATAENAPRILRETINLGGAEVARRGPGGVFFENKQVEPKLSSSESLISLFEEEDKLFELVWGLKKMFLHDQSRAELPWFTDSSAWPNKPTYADAQSIIAVPYTSEFKLIELYRYFPEEVAPIFGAFKEIFPTVEDLRFVQPSVENLDREDNERYLLQIREADRWIRSENVSSGMRRTLSNLADLYLASPGSIVLIDEFENSMGVNCLDFVTNVILSKRKDIQFIITSHHPYIINQVPMPSWRVVLRRGHVVSVRDAGDLGLGLSKHDAFLQLLNSEPFTEGIGV